MHHQKISYSSYVLILITVTGVDGDKSRSMEEFQKLLFCVCCSLDSLSAMTAGWSFLGLLFQLWEDASVCLTGSEEETSQGRRKYLHIQFDMGALGKCFPWVRAVRKLNFSVYIRILFSCFSTCECLDFSLVLDYVDMYKCIGNLSSEC